MRSRVRRSTDLDQFLGDDEARQLADSILAGDWDSAYKLYISNTSAPSRNLALWALDGSNPLPGLDERIQATQQRDPVALIVRGIHGVGRAWDARGSYGSEHVKKENWRIFFDFLGQSDVDLHRAARLLPTDPVIWNGLLVTARGLQIPKAELDMRFEMLWKRDQHNYAGHSVYLQGIAGKWNGGSNTEMWEYAVAVHQAAPAGSPLHAIVADAFVERLIISEETCGPDCLPWLIAAADASIFHPDFQRFDHIDKQSALTVFAQAFYFTKDQQRGARTVELIGDYPSEDGTIYISNSKNAGARWDKLCKAFA